jgi:hypothetical protein
MKKLIAYMLLIGLGFIFVPMVAENTLNIANAGYITKLEALNDDYSNEKLLKVGINYTLCLNVLSNNEFKHKEYLNCKTQISNAKINLYMSK